MPKKKRGFGIRNWQRKTGHGNQRISVWVTEEMSKWKDDTKLTWGQILQAGVEYLSSGTSPGIFAHNTIADLNRRLDFFVQKTQDFQKDIEKMKEEAVKNGNANKKN